MCAELLRPPVRYVLQPHADLRCPRRVQFDRCVCVLCVADSGVLGGCDV